MTPSRQMQIGACQGLGGEERQHLLNGIGAFLGSTKVCWYQTETASVQACECSKHTNELYTLKWRILRSMNLPQFFKKENRAVPVAYACPGAGSAGLTLPAPEVLHDAPGETSTSHTASCASLWALPPSEGEGPLRPLGALRPFSG